MNHRLPRTLAPAALVAVAALALTACGSSSGATSSSGSPAASGSSSSSGSSAGGSTDCPPGTPASADYTVGTEGVSVTGDLGKAPTVKLGADTSKVTKLTVCDLVPGTGAAIAAGASITAQYVGIGAVSGKKFDSSWDRGKPAKFSLSGVIEGWTKGIPGMKVGGRRLLVIPGAQAYGASPPSADIAANEALVFVVDAVPTPVPTVGPHVQGTAGVTVTGDPGKAPTIAVSPETAKVSQLTINDITVGTGAEAKAGATVTVNYVGAGGTTGKTFDSTWTNGKTASFDLSQIITGIADGVPGMKVGGRRLIVMPAAQGFGASVPSGLDIQANEPLVFVVDLVSVP
ncbi:MAG TPA: FKBP-type peptidyl-prolyl cis-trans isomerase [Candidatus Nanopelagicales bacterium]